MAGNFDAWPDFQNSAGRIDQECRARDSFEDLAVQRLVRNNAERIAQLGFRIRNQLERQLVLGFKLLMRADGIAADADDLRALAFELRVCVAELRRLIRSTRRCVFRVEPQHQGLSEQIAGVQRFAFIPGHRNARHLRAWFEHVSSFAIPL